MFKELWIRHGILSSLVSDSQDSWVDRVLDDILTYVVHSGSVRHVAILGYT